MLLIDVLSLFSLLFLFFSSLIFFSAWIWRRFINVLLESLEGQWSLQRRLGRGPSISSSISTLLAYRVIDYRLDPVLRSVVVFMVREKREVGPPPLRCRIGRSVWCLRCCCRPVCVCVCVLHVKVPSPFHAVGSIDWQVCKCGTSSLPPPPSPPLSLSLACGGPWMTSGTFSFSRPDVKLSSEATTES